MHKFAAHIQSWFRAVKRRPRTRESFERMFNDFRLVLDRNNRSLEVITDMGDTLGGDYLFDLQYIRRSYAALHAAVGESVAGFDALTSDRYPRLRERFEAINGQIRHVIDETAPASGPLVVFYEDLAGDMRMSVGGKNANLAELKNALKLSIPEAFAITTRAFDVFMGHNSVFAKVPLPEDGAPVSEASLHDLQGHVLHGAMPPELSRAIERAIKKIKSRCGPSCRLAVRSSAGEEDGDLSFAGQFDTELNVPLDPVAVEEAYRKVLASLYSGKASAYQGRMGYDPTAMKMAVACVAMVEATASGVLYSSDPQGDRETLVINSTWGLGTSIVEGQTDADFFRVKKKAPYEIIESRIGAKDTLVTPLDHGGVETVATPEEKKKLPSLTPGQIAELARTALRIEQHFKQPQDIEWALDGRGTLHILQARPLRLTEDPNHCAIMVPESPGSQIIVQGRGIAVQKGVAAGRVYILKHERDLGSIPRGAVLVARHDSSHFVRVMTDVAAILTDTGTPTSHMATLCREFRIPTVVNAGDLAQTLVPGQEITVQVNGEGATLYQGPVAQLLECAQDEAAKLGELLEFRKKRYLLRYISPLNLVDPLRDEFTPQACRTMHDILRFIHEKSVAELIESAERIKAGSVKLDLPIPAGIMLIDIGGGLENPEGEKHVVPGRITSLPLRAIIAGMTRPGVWRSDAVPLRMNDFMTSMLRVPDITTDAGGRVEQNMAVISREYANVSIKFGYHFIVLDCFCSENARNNHIYFRFAGGATDIAKRSRRLQLIAAILTEYRFNIKTKGDLIVARLANISRQEAETTLDQIGRLFSYTRQLDAVLNDDHDVERYARSFLEEKYELV
jgi:pyruvate,water dikinase